jgi:hypothetical protein
MNLPELDGIECLKMCGNPIYNVVCSHIGSHDHAGNYTILDIVKKNVKILNRFRFRYYCLKFKPRFRHWLWEKVREDKIKKQFHPNALSAFLEENEVDDMDKLFMLSNTI